MGDDVIIAGWSTVHSHDSLLFIVYINLVWLPGDIHDLTEEYLYHKDPNMQ